MQHFGPTSAEYALTVMVAAKQLVAYSWAVCFLRVTHLLPSLSPRIAANCSLGMVAQVQAGFSSRRSVLSPAVTSNPMTVINALVSFLLVL